MHLTKKGTLSAGLKDLVLLILTVSAIWVCDCPTGYSIINPNDKMSGWKPNFDVQNCDEEACEGNPFRFVDIPNTDWPARDGNGSARLGPIGHELDL